MLEEYEFLECSSCLKKPGAPGLCPTCLHNRASINALNAKVRTYEAEIKLLREFCEGVMSYLAEKFLHREF